MKKSLFVAIEGIDRSGKSSLVRALENSLLEKGYFVSVIRYPNRNNHTGQLINDVLNGKKVLSKESMHLLFSANRWEDKERLEGLIRPSTDQSMRSVVLCDRYILSGLSYSVANGIPVKFAMASDKGQIIPDITLFLDVSPETVESREGFGTEIYENRPFQEKVYESMKELVEEYEHKKIPSMKQDEMHSSALSYILNLLN